MSGKKKSVILFDPKAKTENFKRPNHPDFMDASELQKIKWTGVRPNNMGLSHEFWILGEIKRRVPFADVQKDPQLMQKVHIELFGLYEGNGNG